MAYDIFPYLSDNDQLKLLQQARVNRFEQGATVVDQNVESRSIYIVRDGSVVVELYDGGAWIQLAHLGLGDIFGEMSTLYRPPAIAIGDASNLSARMMPLAVQRPTKRAFQASQSPGDFGAALPVCRLRK